MKYLNKDIDTIFIVLGKGCNFNCRYCMQNETHKSGIIYPTEINEDIYEFIEEIVANQKYPPYIHFYGGEPLLYKDKIKIIVGKLQHINNIRFSIITNGSLIDEEMINLFNSHDFHVNISWDGHFSSKTRKRDVFKENKENLFKINQLGISMVISSITPLGQLINDAQNLFNEYKEKTGNDLYINYDEVYDANIADKSLLNVDYEEYSKIARRIFKECIKIKTGEINIPLDTFKKKYWAKMSFFERMYWNVRNYATNEKKCIKYMARCCNGIEILNLDLEGNLYSCHNCDTKLGTIYSSYINYLDELFKNDDIKYYFKKYCSQCLAYPICRGGCKLIGEEVRNESYCKLKKAIFIPAIEEILAITKQ